MSVEAAAKGRNDREAVNVTVRRTGIRNSYYWQVVIYIGQVGKGSI